MDASDAVEKALVGRWIAGNKIDDAIARTRRFNSRGVRTIINYLGEEITDKRSVDDAVRTYARLIGAIRRSRVEAEVSLKLTQLGLNIDSRLAEKNYAKIVALARRHRVFVWIDAESHNEVPNALAIYKRHAAKGLVGITVQSVLKRSADDIKSILKSKGVVRLVKGAYKEPQAEGFRTRAAITRNYYRLMDYLFRHSSRFVIATHDLNIIRRAIKLNKIYNRDVSFAMLNGIRNKYIIRLAKEGHVAYVYVPFGPSWVAYSLRRMKEASNVKLLLKSALENQDI